MARKLQGLVVLAAGRREGGGTEQEVQGMATPYDVIVVGARCAGSPTAMLLAQKGYRVLVVDRAKFPSDTVSTHFMHPPGVASLARWGLLDAVRASGCPPVTTYSFDFGPIKIAGSPHPFDGVAEAYGPRRTVLDKILVDAAIEAGVEFREQFSVQEVLFDGDRGTGVRGRDANGGGGVVTEHAAIVVGADGMRSMVARAAPASQPSVRSASWRSGSKITQPLLAGPRCDRAPRPP